MLIQQKSVIRKLEAAAHHFLTHNSASFHLTSYIQAGATHRLIPLHSEGHSEALNLLPLVQLGCSLTTYLHVQPQTSQNIHHSWKARSKQGGYHSEVLTASWQEGTLIGRHDKVPWCFHNLKG
jgi:hypothetical protein